MLGGEWKVLGGVVICDEWKVLGEVVIRDEW